MVNWLQKGDIYINQPNLCSLTTQFDINTNLWYIAYSFDGVQWIRDTVDSFNTQAAAKSALNTYVTGLG